MQKTSNKTRLQLLCCMAIFGLLSIQSACSFSTNSLPMRFLAKSPSKSAPRDQFQLMEASSISNDEQKVKPSPNKKKKLLITLWIHVISIFVMLNYLRPNCCPQLMLQVPLSVWNLIHGLSGMLFSGAIMTTTLLEWNINKDVGGIFPKLLQVETYLVLPALTGSMISGVAQAFHNYSTLRWAPRHVKSALHLLFAFGLWWGLTDRRSQEKVNLAIRKGDWKDPVWNLRRVANLVSCGFLVALYGVMILKPGYIP